jgi:hypothetical protein
MHYLRLIFILLLFAAAIMLTVPRRIFELEKSQAVGHQYDLALAELKDLKLVTGPNVDARAPQYRQNVENLAWVYWQENKLFDAEAWFRILVNNRKSDLGKNYDPNFIKDQLCLAGVYRDWARYYQAEAVYLEIQAYEHKYFKSPDIHLARDYGNLSLIYYLESAAQVDPRIKAVQLSTARGFSNAAEDEFKKVMNEKKQNTQREIGNVLANRYYILRDLGFSDQAKETKEKADAILGSAHNVAIEP